MHGTPKKALTESRKTTSRKACNRLGTLGSFGYTMSKARRQITKEAPSDNEFPEDLFTMNGYNTAGRMRHDHATKLGEVAFLDPDASEQPILTGKAGKKNRKAKRPEGARKARLTSMTMPTPSPHAFGMATMTTLVTDSATLRTPKRPPAPKRRSGATA
jgi:hypothetical protein